MAGKDFNAVRLAFGLFEWVRPVHKYSEENEKAVKITRKSFESVLKIETKSCVGTLGSFATVGSGL